MVFWKVLLFLDAYYIRNEIPDKGIKKLDIVSRWFIAASYFLIDAIYPISFALLYKFYQLGQSSIYIDFSFCV